MALTGKIISESSEGLNRLLRVQIGTQDGKPIYGLAVVSVDENGNLMVGGGGAATIANGADVTQGSTADVAVVSDANGTISGKLRGMVKILADAWDSVNHALRVQGNVGGYTTVASGSFTRPNDTTAYATNDAVTNSTSNATAITFANAARVAAGSGVILSARLVKSAPSSSPGGAAASGFRLWLYGSMPASVTADNAAFQIAAADVRFLVLMDEEVPDGNA